MSHSNDTTRKKGKLTPSVEIITGEEHGEQEDDPGIRFESDEQAHEFSLPGWVTDLDDSSTICTDHLVGVSHQEGDEDADESQD